MIMGLGFPAHEHDLIMQSIEGLTAMQRDPQNPVNRSLGLDLYRYMCGQTAEQIAQTGRESSSGIWEDIPPHLWEPPEDAPDVDFDKAETYEQFMKHFVMARDDDSMELQDKLRFWFSRFLNM
jgi:hypothetical protein